jgi:hypothetical protein
VAPDTGDHAAGKSRIAARSSFSVYLWSRRTSHQKPIPATTKPARIRNGAFISVEKMITNAGTPAKKPIAQIQRNIAVLSCVNACLLGLSFWGESSLPQNSRLKTHYCQGQKKISALTKLYFELF